MDKREETRATTAERLKEAMRLAGKKQADLMRETGLDRGAISSYLSGKYEPKQTAINKLAKALNVSEMWLWGYDVPMERSLMQQKNETLAGLVVRMRTDSEFFEAVKKIDSLDPEKLSSLLALLK